MAGIAACSSRSTSLGWVPYRRCTIARIVAWPAAALARWLGCVAVIAFSFYFHRSSGRLCRTELTTSRIARVVAPAYFCSATSASCVAPAITRCTLLADSVAVLFCAVIHAASCPTLAVRTIRGLSPKSRREVASWVEALARRYSSTVLATVLAFAVLARTSSLERGGRVPKETWAYRRARPTRAGMDARVEIRPMAL